MNDDSPCFSPFAKLPTLALAFLSFTASTLVIGCASDPIIIKVAPAIAAKLKSEIPTYDRKTLNGINYKVVLPLEATSCMKLIWDPPVSQEDVLNQLRMRARTLHANGIMDVSCGNKEGVSLVTNCWETISCNATAIQVNP